MLQMCQCNKRVAKIIVKQGFNLATILFLISNISAYPISLNITPFVDIGLDIAKTTKYKEYEIYRKGGFVFGPGLHIYAKHFYCNLSYIHWLIEEGLLGKLNSFFSGQVGLVFHKVKLETSSLIGWKGAFDFMMITGNIGYIHKIGIATTSINGGISYIKENYLSGTEEIILKYKELHNFIEVFIDKKYIKPYLRTGITYLIKGKNISPFFSIGLQLKLILAPNISKGYATPSARSYNYPPGIRKPNIYLYPEKDTEVYVTLIPKNGNFLTISIPPYNNGWRVKVNSYGKIDDIYDYLFYEGVWVNKPSIINTGWCIKEDSIWEFFNSKLKEYGFNDKEIADFLDYWKIELPKAKFYIIAPLHTDQVNNEIDIKVNPEPQSILRVWFYIIPTNNYKKMQEPHIPTFVRRGFVLTEWGVIIEE